MSKKIRPVNKTQDKTHDKSPTVFQRDVLKAEIAIRELNWTDKQRQFIDEVGDKRSQVIFVNGPAGSSKTLLGIFCLLQFLNAKKISDIVLVRSVVESSDNKLGFLPGSSSDKLCPYLVPFFDKFGMFISPTDLLSLQKDERISAFPISFLRGLDWNRRGIVLDEAQNLSVKELLTFMTRIGKYNKVFILGDPDQSDIRNSGFAQVFDLFNNEESKDKGINCFQFGPEDVMRSELCKFIAQKFGEMKRTYKEYNASHKKSQLESLKPGEEWRPSVK